MSSFNDHFKKIVGSHKEYLSALYDECNNIGYEKECMFVLALWQYIEALFVVDNDIKERDEFSHDDVMKYVNIKYHNTYISVKRLREVINEMMMSCCMDECSCKVQEFMDHERLGSMLTELGVLDGPSKPTVSISESNSGKSSIMAAAMKMVDMQDNTKSGITRLV